MQKPSIVLVATDETLCCHVRERLLRHGYAVMVREEAKDILHMVHHTHPALVIIESAHEKPWQSIEVAQRLRHWDRTLPVIFLASWSSEELAIAALRVGVQDYFKSPFSLAALAASVHRILTATRASLPSAPDHLQEVLMIGESAPMQHLKAYLEKVAVTDCNVLITGETGTGKELAAALIHHHSPRCQQPLMCINCAAIPDSLIESELFGHERGAFTGAHAAQAGMLQRAAGSTVFLDEVGDMSPYAQAKILRAVEHKEVQRLGGQRSIPLNIRLIAATNQDLAHLVALGTFRKDLYFRLNVVHVHLPPLRERKEDLLLLCTDCIRECNGRFGRHVEGLTEEALTCLLGYDWPGNVRELKNVIEAAFVNLPARHITLLDLPEPFRRWGETAAGETQVERDRVLDALFATNWNKRKAAQKLHWSRMTLYRKMAKYHIVSSAKTVGSTTSLDRPV
jgi:DNA-binding NtrC family response regulator